MIYLYIKQHSVTGLKYFGKTISKDPIKYPGSGTKWKNHINKHGRKYVITTHLWMFYDQDECKQFALKFSKDNNIVEEKINGKKTWANLVYEDGYNGNTGMKHSKETRVKMFLSSKGKPKTEEHKNNLRNIIRSDLHKLNLSKALRGKCLSEEHKRKISLNHPRHTNKARLNQPHSDETKQKISQSNLGQIRSKDTKRKIAVSKKNRMWITNNNVSKMIKITEFNLYDSSWRKGRVI